MKTLILFFLLVYCHTSELLVFGGKNFNLVSITNAQSMGSQHQTLICQKLHGADFNNDGSVDEEDYSLIYLVSIHDQETVEKLTEEGFSLDLMDINALPKSSSEVLKPQIDDEDISLLYSYLTNQLPFCTMTKE
jgi:hypothetical protein